MSKTLNSNLEKVLAANAASRGSDQNSLLPSSIDRVHADALYRMVFKQEPNLMIEIGLANGVSSIASLSAMQDAGKNGRLISIDPNQTSEWSGKGVANVNSCGLSSQHQLIEKVDYLALPELLAQRHKIDFAYIDGWHTFDYTLLDFFYLDKMLRVGGVIGFNDCGFRAVHKVLNFVLSHRKYEEVDAGLKPDYCGRNLAVTGVRKLLKLSRSDRYFRKIEDWEPGWNYYSRF